MVAPIVYGLGMLAARALPYVARALPSIGRGAFWVAKQPVTNTARTALAVGGAHYATDGASTRVILGAGEVAASGVGLVVGKDNVESAGRTVLDTGAKIGVGLAGAGTTVVQRYGPDIVSDVAGAVPVGKLSTLSTVLSGGAQDGGIQVPDTLRPSGAFRERAEDIANDAEDMFGGLVDSAELARWGALAKQDALSNRFIQAGLAIGGVTGAMDGNGVGGRAANATKNALVLALLFGAIGHFLFGQHSNLITEASSKLSNAFNKTASGTPEARVEDVPAPAPRAPQISSQRPLMTPALSMG
jgi:hypothetical protein